MLSPPPNCLAPPLAKNDVVIELRALSLAAGRSEKVPGPRLGVTAVRGEGGKGRMGLLVEAGGVIQIVARDSVKAGEDLPLGFNVGNPDADPRYVQVHASVRAPGDLRKLRVEIRQPEGEFKPNETRKVTAVLTDRPEAPQRTCPPPGPTVCPQWPGPYLVAPPPCPPERRGLFRRWR